MIVLVWVCFLHNRVFDEISCSTLHLLQVKHASKNPSDLELGHAPAALMCLATHVKDISMMKTFF